MAPVPVFSRLGRRNGLDASFVQPRVCMGLVQYALKFRVSFYVLAVIMMLGGIGSGIVGTKAVLPNVNIPVVVIVWTDRGKDRRIISMREAMRGEADDYFKAVG